MSWFRKKCVFCKEKDTIGNPLLESFSWGIYDSTYFYHNDCLKDCLNNPQKYGNHKVDVTLDIVAREEYKKIKLENRQKKINKAINFLEEQETV